MITPALRFADFCLDIRGRELRCAGQAIPTQAKVFDCLAYLAQNRDRAVGRDELIAAVWGKTDVSDNVLGQIVGRARNAVGDTGEAQHTIRTVPRFGYRWVRPVDDPNDIERSGTATDADSQAKGPSALLLPASAGLPSRAARYPFTRRVVSMLAVTIACIVAVAIVGVGRLPRKTTGHPTGRGVVLPVVLASEGAYSWIRLGVMDLIADRLRAAGQPMMTSDNVLMLASGFADASGHIDARALAAASSADLVFDARAEFAQGRWHVSLRSVYGYEPALQAEGESADVLDAARVAAGDMAHKLGYDPPSDPDVPPGDDLLVKLLVEVKSDILSNRLDDARALIASAPASIQARTEVRYQNAALDLSAGHFDAAGAAFESLSNELSGSDNPVLQAEALHGLGFSLFRRSRYLDAERYYDEAVHLLENRDDPDARGALGRTEKSLGATHTFLRRFDDAERDYAQSRIALETIGDRIALASLDNNTGVLATEQGHYAEALPYFERSANQSAVLHDIAGEVRVRINIADACLALLEPAAALVSEARLAVLLPQVADPRLNLFADLVRVRVLIANGRLQAANALLQEAFVAVPGVGDASMTGYAHMVAADLAFARGAPDDVTREARAALTMDLGPDGDSELIYARWNLLRARLQLGDLDGVASVAEEARRDGTRRSEPSFQLYAALAEGEEAAAAGNAKSARNAFELALSRAGSNRNPSDLLQVCSAYTQFLIGINDLSRASVVAGRIGGWADRDYGASLLQLRLYHATGSARAWQNALTKAQALAGDRTIPAELVRAPASRMGSLKSAIAWK